MKFQHYEMANGSVSEMEYRPRPLLEIQLVTSLIVSAVAVIVLIPNILCIAAILSHANTRRVRVNWYIVSLCVATSMTIIIRASRLFTNYEYGDLGATRCSFFTIIHSWLTTTLACTVLALNLDRFIWLFRRQWYFRHEKTVTFALIGLSWFFPLANAALVVGVNAYKYGCLLAPHQPYSVAAIGFLFQVPASMILCVGVGVIWRYNTGNTPNNERLCEPYESPWRGDYKPLIVALIVVDVLFIAMWLPVYTLELIDVSYYPLNVMHLAMTLLGYVNLTVMPCLWCIHPRIRQSFSRLCCCCCRRHTDIHEVAEPQEEMMPCVPSM